MDATAIALALTALLFPQASSLEYEGHNLTYCPEVPDKRAFLAEVHQRIKDDQQQYIGNVTMFKDWGNDNTFIIEAFRILPDREVHLLTYRGKHACNTLKAYGGDKYLGVARKANVPNPNKCPVAKGNYAIREYIGIRVSDVPRELRQLAPKGKFRVRGFLKDTKTGNIDFCAQVFVEKY